MAEQPTTTTPPQEQKQENEKEKEKEKEPFTPNHGASIPDEVAIGPNSLPLSTWKTTQNIDRTQQIQLVSLVHMRYQHPSLPTIKTFLQDFGMQIARETPTEIWFRGYGTDPYVYYARQGPKAFLGGTFSVASREELEKAAAHPSATGPIFEVGDSAPGGGWMVTLRDPEGFPVNLIWGQTAVERREFPEKVILNDETDKPRVRKFNRFTTGPAAVHKLGHYGLCIHDFSTQLNYYTQTFNLVPTDILYVPVPDPTSRKEVAAFLHIDLGPTPVDHHTFFMSTIPPTTPAHVHHSSFEVHDFDTQHLGHQHLAQRGYTSVWGVGRHILGSQIFDYWWDPTGNMVEHYCDGDLVNGETPVGWGEAGDEGLAVWGPEVPKWFLE